MNVGLTNLGKWPELPLRVIWPSQCTQIDRDLQMFSSSCLYFFFFVKGLSTYTGEARFILRSLLVPNARTSAEREEQYPLCQPTSL